MCVLYMHIYIYVHTHIYIYRHLISIYLYLYTTYIYIYRHTHTCVCVCVSVCVCVCTESYVICESQTGKLWSDVHVVNSLVLQLAYIEILAIYTRNVEVVTPVVLYLKKNKKKKTCRPLKNFEGFFEESSTMSSLGSYVWLVKHLHHTHIYMQIYSSMRTPI